MIIDLSGQSPSKAALLKIVGNTMVVAMVESLASAHVLAEKSGLGVENLQQFVDVFFGGPYSAYSRRLSSGDYWNREEVRPSRSAGMALPNSSSPCSPPTLHGRMLAMP